MLREDGAVSVGLLWRYCHPWGFYFFVCVVVLCIFDVSLVIFMYLSHFYICCQLPLVCGRQGINYASNILFIYYLMWANLKFARQKGHLECFLFSFPVTVIHQNKTNILFDSPSLSCLPPTPCLESIMCQLDRPKLVLVIQSTVRPGPKAIPKMSARNTLFRLSLLTLEGYFLTLGTGTGYLVLCWIRVFEV